MSIDKDERRNMEERKKFIKDAMKEAFKEYLEEKTTQFGKWSMRTIFAAVFSSVLVALIYFVLTINGWQHIPAVAHGSELHQ